MAINTPFYPYGTTNGQGSFSIQSAGFIQGQAMDSPNSRFNLAIGNLSASATGPVWGGMAISENIAASTSDATGGGSILAATAQTNLTGFSVFDQSYSWVGSPNSPVPTAGYAGDSINFYRLGSGARIAVAMDPSLVSLDGGLITQQVSWDFNNQVLQPYDASTATYALSTAVATYNNNGTWTVAIVAAVATPVAAVGDAINISGVTGTGSSFVNGNQVISSFTDNEHFSILVTAPELRYGRAQRQGSADERW
jgi:hypothetical protein